jgi:hypothetical protein
MDEGVRDADLNFLRDNLYELRKGRRCLPFFYKHQIGHRMGSPGQGFLVSSQLPVVRGLCSRQLTNDDWQQTDKATPVAGYFVNVRKIFM